MQPTLTWIDLTASDRDRMCRVLDLFSEQGTLDEMGLGSLRDVLSNALFPGTSYIHTRLRYVLFIPWIYQRLEKRRAGGDVAQQARRAEIDLIGRLERSPDKEGIIGVQARHALVRLPSTVYWSALARWDLFRGQCSQGWYHAHFAALTDGRNGVEHADDPGVVWSRQPNWHPRLPEAPPSFPEEASFALRPEEARFLQGRWEERCADTLLAWLACEGSDTPADNFWDDPDVRRAPPAICRTVELAQRFSLHVEGMPLLYNLLVAEGVKDDHDRDTDAAADGEPPEADRRRPAELIDKYRESLREWAVRETREASYAPHVLWDFAARRGTYPPAPQRRFIESWSERIAGLAPGAVADDGRLRRLVADREVCLKGPRARLANRNRRLDWRPGVGVGRMDFRWVRVRQFLIDLHRGLAA